MDSIKKTDGFTLIETLTAITLLGIVSVLSVIIFTGIYSNPRLLLKGEAAMLAEQELHYSINNKVKSDTIYSSGLNGLEIVRKVLIEENLYKITVSVVFKPKTTKILSLSAWIAQ